MTDYYDHPRSIAAEFDGATLHLPTVEELRAAPLGTADELDALADQLGHEEGVVSTESPAVLLDHYEGAVRALVQDGATGANVDRLHAYERDLLSLAACCGDPLAVSRLFSLARTVVLHEVAEDDATAADLDQWRARQVEVLLGMLGGAS